MSGLSYYHAATRQAEEQEDSNRMYVTNNCGKDMCVIDMESNCDSIVNTYRFEGQCCSLKTRWSSSSNEELCTLRVSFGDCSYSNSSHTITYKTNSSIVYCPNNAIASKTPQEQAQKPNEPDNDDDDDDDDDNDDVDDDERIIRQEEKETLFVSESAVRGTIFNEKEMILSSLPPLETARANAAGTVSRVGSVDVFTVPKQQQATNGDDTDAKEQEEIGLCHLPFLMPFSFPAGATIPKLGIKAPFRIPMNTFRTHQAYATALLAAHHLNTGDGSVIPEVQDLPNQCNIRFTMEALDTYWDPATTIQHVQHVADRSPSGDKPMPCIFVGAGQSGSTISASIFTSTQNIPIFSPLSQSIALDNKEQHPLFGRLCGHTAADIVVVIRFYKEILNVQHLGVVYVNNEYGISYVRELQDKLRNHSPEMLDRIRITAVDEGNYESVEIAIQSLKDTKYRYFLAAAPNAEELLREAYHVGIAGTGKHHWLFTGIANYIHKDVAGVNREFQRDDPFYLALKGVLQISPVGAVEGLPLGRYAPLAEAFAKFKDSPSDKEYFQYKFPQYSDTSSGFFNFDDPAFFELALNGISTTEVWAYDTIIAAGLAACNVTREGQYFDGPNHYEAMLNVDFVGSTGRVLLDQKTGSRHTASAMFGVANYQAIEDTGNGQPDIAFRVPYLFLDNNFVPTGIPNLNNDGTTQILPDLFEVPVDNNYIGLGLRVYGFLLSAIIIVFSLALVVWTFMHRKERVIRASQPLFLKIICFGTLLMGVSIIPLSLDDEVLTVHEKNIGCNAVSWLFGIGFGTSFSALFAKTWRVNKLFNAPRMKRIKVTPRDVMLPIAIVIFLNVLCLSLWTSQSPLEWRRNVVDTNEFGQPIETVGTCWNTGGGENQLVYAVCTLIVNFGIVILAMFQAYQVRLIHLEFAETQSIIKALVISLIVSLLGIPVMVIVNDNPPAYFFVLASIFFALPLSLLLFIFVPKILYFRKAKKMDDNNTTKQAIRQSFLPSSSSIAILDKELNNHGRSWGRTSQRRSVNWAGNNREQSCSGSDESSAIFILDALQGKMASMEERISDDGRDSEGELDDDDEEDDDAEASASLKVVDSPEMREAMKQENKQLRKDMKELEKLIHALLLKKKNGTITSENVSELFKKCCS